MDEESTTAKSDLNGDSASTTTATDSNATDGQTGSDANNLDDSSKSTDKAADGDNKNDTSGKKDDTPAPLDADLGDWATKRGLPAATTDEQKRAYQDMRDEQREFTRERQAKEDSKTLGDSVEEAKKNLKPADDDKLDPLEKRLAAVEADRVSERNLRLQNEFYTAEKVTTAEHKLILDIFKEKVDRQPDNATKLKAVDLWGSPEALPDLLDIARARIAKSTDTSAVADKAAQDERARIARESNAKSPNRNATDKTTSDKTEAEAQAQRFRDRFKK